MSEWLKNLMTNPKGAAKKYRAELKNVAGASAYKKLMDSANKSAKTKAVKALKSQGGSAAKKSNTPKSKTKAMQEYYDRMKKTHKKHGIKTSRKKGYSI